MTLRVQKYGGSSVAGAERIQAVAERIARARQAGDQVVAVVSAMGKTTDQLIELAQQVSNGDPDARELDVLLSTGETVSSTLLAMALHARGCPAISLTGLQAGIRTDAFFSRARILTVDPERIRQELEQGRVVIVAGFQGITEQMDVTTLGRGGSDTTAVALAAALRASTCEIYTDVEGVYTADPRIVPEARKLPTILYEEMMELATQGAKVMHNRAVELGWAHGVPIYVASSFNDAPGTLIQGTKQAGGPMQIEVSNKVQAIAHDMNVAKITLLRVPDRPGIASALFAPLAEAGVSVDVIVQNSSVEKLTDLSFTVARGDAARAREIVERVGKTISAGGVTSDDTLAKVSIVGAGMQDAPGYAARMFQTLAEAHINIEMITTSEIRITCIVRREATAEAVRALHRAFRLETPEGAPKKE